MRILPLLLMALAGLQFALPDTAWAAAAAQGNGLYGGPYPTRPSTADGYRRPCPKGTTGLWPYCRTLVQPTTPKCPRGSFGQWPRCLKIAKPQCPSGTSGRWPHCRKNDPPRRPCPAGTAGTWPSCRTLATPAPPHRTKYPLRQAAPLPAPIRPSPILQNDQRPDELVLLLSLAQGIDVATALARQYRLLPLQGETNRLLQARIQRYRIPDRRTPAQALASMRGDGRILLAQPNYLYRLKSGPAADSLAGRQYALEKIHLAAAHGLAQGRQTSVAVIDSAVDAGHPELAGAVTQSFDAVEDRPAQADPHGTAVAGIIAAHGRMLGIAPASRLLAARAFFQEGAEPLTTSFILLRAINWAFSQRARIFNLSFTGPRDPALERLLESAYKQGAILVAAAGNDGPQAPPAYPAAYPPVIAVTALDPADRPYAKANRGNYLALAAPGVDILTLAPGRGYGFQSGTSFAAAHVSGLIALMLERNPTLTPAQVRALLTGTATDLGTPGADAQFGAGRIDALRSVQALTPTPRP